MTALITTDQIAQITALAAERDTWGLSGANVITLAAVEAGFRKVDEQSAAFLIAGLQRLPRQSA